jgi:hypothetical protein
MPSPATRTARLTRHWPWSICSRCWIAVSVYALVAIVRKSLGIEASLYQLLQIFSVTLFEKTPFYGHFRDLTPKKSYTTLPTN